jgi:prepilin peptidase CpaA
MTAALVAPMSALLLFACWTDISTLRIPNWISIAIVALFVIAALELPPKAIIPHLLAGGLAAAGGTALFAARQLGGGDVKLLAAVALWVGWDAALIEMLLIIGIAAAIVSLIVIAIRSRLLERAFAHCVHRPAILDPTSGAPFAVAITAGFLIIAIRDLPGLR